MSVSFCFIEQLFIRELRRQCDQSASISSLGFSAYLEKYRIRTYKMGSIWQFVWQFVTR